MTENGQKTYGTRVFAYRIQKRTSCFGRVKREAELVVGRRAPARRESSGVRQGVLKGFAESLESLINQIYLQMSVIILCLKTCSLLSSAASMVDIPCLCSSRLYHGTNVEKKPRRVCERSPGYHPFPSLCSSRTSRHNVKLASSIMRE
jgi:hypothetical protein